MINIAINGFGRIGRNFLRAVLEDSLAKDIIKVVAINVGPSGTDGVAHLFEYDSLMGKYPGKVFIDNDVLIVDDYKIALVAEADPVKLPWKKFNVDWVVESSGHFRTRELASKHISAGAKKVLVSAPMKDDDVTIILGINDSLYDRKKHHVVSLGSCTSNALLPIVKVLHEEFEIKRGFMTTIHSYTNDQVLLDVEKSDPRRARAAALNIIPTSTGATNVIGKVFPELGSKIHGCSVRVPVAKVSLIDLCVETVKNVSVQQVNDSLEDASNDSLLGIMDVSHEPLVSSDFSGNSHSVVIDSLITETEGNLIKVFGWYDNEWAYSVRIKNFLEQNGKI